MRRSLPSTINKIRAKICVVLPTMKWPHMLYVVCDPAWFLEGLWWLNYLKCMSYNSNIGNSLAHDFCCIVYVFLV